MRTLRIFFSLAVLALLAAPPAARAARGSAQSSSQAQSSSHIALGLGADYLVDPEVGEFQLTLAYESHLARMLTAGVRAGVLLTGDPTKVGAPIDFRLRLRTHRLYFDGLVGPWLVFDSGDTLRFHGALGFGLLTGAMSLGLEVGALDHTGMIGLRLGFSL
jgi:hypothetical protein